MTVEELILETRQHRTGRPEPLTLELVENLLHITLAFILESVDYERDVAATPAQVARVLASMLATLEDQRLH
jgi:hypothetical protein